MSDLTRLLGLDELGKVRDSISSVKADIDKGEDFVRDLEAAFDARNIAEILQLAPIAASYALELKAIVTDPVIILTGNPFAATDKLIEAYDAKHQAPPQQAAQVPVDAIPSVGDEPPPAAVILAAAAAAASAAAADPTQAPTDPASDGASSTTQNGSSDSDTGADMNAPTGSDTRILTADQLASA